MRTIKKRSFGICPVAIDHAGAPRFLLLRAYRNWDFPKGGAEAGETPLDAALRELQEETGICDTSLEWGPVFRETGIYAGGKVASYFIARVVQQDLSLPVNAELGKPEHEEYRWASASEARQLLPPRLIPILDWAESTVVQANQRPDTPT